MLSPSVRKDWTGQSIRSHLSSYLSGRSLVFGGGELEAGDSLTGNHKHRTATCYHPVMKQTHSIIQVMSLYVAQMKHMCIKICLNRIAAVLIGGNKFKW